MFLCEKCHPKNCNCWGVSRSMGPCEDCRKVSVCVDCHGTTPTAHKKPRKTKAKRT